MTSAETCKICKRPTRRICFKQKSYGQRRAILYHVCDVCQFAAKDRSAYLPLEAERKIYLQHDNQIGDARYLAFFDQFIAKAILPFRGKGRLGLDFGSGPQPVLASHLAQRYDYAMDIHDPFFAPNPIKATQPFDLITCTEVLEHLSDPLAAFLHLQEHLRPGGLLAIMTLFRPPQASELSDWFYTRDPTHISFFRPRTLREMASHSHLDLIYCDHHRYATFKHTS